jgi:hypothetical protein
MVLARANMYMEFMGHLEPFILPVPPQARLNLEKKDQKTLRSQS